MKTYLISNHLSKNDYYGHGDYYLLTWESFEEYKAHFKRVWQDALVKFNGEIYCKCHSGNPNSNRIKFPDGKSSEKCVEFLKENHIYSVGELNPMDVNPDFNLLDGFIVMKEFKSSLPRGLLDFNYY